VFVIASSSSLDEDAIEQISGGNPENRTLLENAKPASMIVGPTGQIIGEPVVGGEGFAVADIDISEAIVLKEAHDTIGRYKVRRVPLRVNQARINPVCMKPSAVSKTTCLLRVTTRNSRICGSGNSGETEDPSCAGRAVSKAVLLHEELT
jgi:nitrilase